MGNPVIVLNSVTWAIRAQKLLEQKGIRTYMRKISHVPNAKGCGYGLEVRGDVQQALEILSRADIRVMKVM